jgi:Tfp pilus assembly PilM family ATPase
MYDHGIGVQRPAGSPTSAPGEPERQHPANSEDQQVANLVFAAIRRDLTALAGEAERSLAYAMHVYGDLQVSCVHLAGGGSGLRGLGPFLSQAIGVPVTVADALGDDPPSDAGPTNGGAWVKPVGLALLDYA